MRHKKHLRSVLCLVMTMLLVIGVVLGVGAADSDLAQTSATSTIYFKNTENWSTVNAYVWVKNTSNSVKAWPGEAMTLVEDNIYKYTVSGDYNMIIFNNGSTQTKDLDLGKDGYLYDYSANSWLYYTEPTPTDPTQETDTPDPTDAPDPIQSSMVYFKNTASWSSVNAYMWKSGSGENAGWPGQAMTDIGDGVWQYEVKGDYNNIIFNNGSTQTGDLSYPGGGYIYNYDTSKWEVYDTSPIVVTEAGTDLVSPQYKGSEIELTATAKSSGGTVYYKFSVTNPAGATTVLKDFSTASTAKWTPTVAGTYTLVFDFKDDSNNENQRTVTYVIEDDSKLEKPVIKKVTPDTKQIKNNTNMNINVTAGGGNVGTKLLFYKYVVKDASGNILNVPYYTKNASYTFKPTKLGEFTVTVYVQNSENTVAQRTYDFVSVTNPTDPTEEPTQKPTDDPIDGILGDVDGDGELSILDATALQMYLTDTDITINLDVADFDKDSEVSILDATAIQMCIVGLEN